MATSARNCGPCGATLDEYQAFCTVCGARWPGRQPTPPDRQIGTGKRLLARLRSLARQALRSQTDSEAEKQLNAIVQSDLPFHDPDSAAFELERLLNGSRIDTNLKSAIRASSATFFLLAGQERVHNAPSWRTDWQLSGIMEDLRESLHVEPTASRDVKAEQVLNEVFDDALHRYHSAAFLGHPDGWKDIGHHVTRLADAVLLITYGVFRSEAAAGKRGEKAKPVRFGDVLLGFSSRSEAADVEYAAEIVWLYEHARRAYERAVALDKTDTKSLLALADLLARLGRPQEAASWFDNTLAILNGALEADQSDKQSYVERADLFERLGQADEVVSNLRMAMSYATTADDVRSLRERLEKLGDS